MSVTCEKPNCTQKKISVGSCCSSVVKWEKRTWKSTKRSGVRSPARSEHCWDGQSPRGQKLSRVINFRNGRVHAMHIFCYKVKLPNLKLATQSLGYLPLDIAPWLQKNILWELRHVSQRYGRQEKCPSVVSSMQPFIIEKIRAHIRHQCKKTAVLRCHRCPNNTGVKKWATFENKLEFWPSNVYK